MQGIYDYSMKYKEMMTPVGGGIDKIPHWASVFNDEMADFWSGEVIWNADMSHYTTLKVGGPADAIVFPRGKNEISLIVQGLRKINVPWVILGRGSNIVVPDEGFRGVVILLGRSFSAIEIGQEYEDTVLVSVQAGCSLAKIVNWSSRHGYSGLEFAAGIPGSVGGAIVMNAGAWKKEIKEVLATVTIMDIRGCFCVTRTGEMDFSYRSWGEESGRIAVEGDFILKKDNAERVSRKCHEYLSLRKERQPRHVASAGSFFKNPSQGKTAGQLIEEAGLKGHSVGGAMVSKVHANFIINNGGATGNDIIRLMKRVQKEVLQHSGVYLEPEVKILGTT